MKKTKVTDTRDGNQATKAKAAIVVNAAQYPATPASPLKTAGTTDVPSSQAFGVPVSVAEAVMAAAWPLARTPSYADLSLAALEHLLLPPMRLGQYRLFRRKGQPFAFAAWAYSSQEVQDRILAGCATLQPDEWNSGPQPWQMILACPFGGDAEVKRIAAEFAGEHSMAPIEYGQHASQSAEAPVDDVNDKMPERGPREAAAPRIFDFMLKNAERAEIHKVSAAYIDQNASAVLSLVTMLLSGPNYAAYTPDSSKILTMARGVGRRSSGILLAAHVNGVLRGFFAGEVRTMVFCKELIGFEHAFFVHPDLRALGLGAALLTCFEKCVCELGGLRGAICAYVGNKSGGCRSRVCQRWLSENW